MRRLLLAAVLFASALSVRGADWFVAATTGTVGGGVNGSSGNTGAIGSPWDALSVLHGSKNASIAACGTIYFRGGTYKATDQRESANYQQYIDVKSGTSGSCVTRLIAYPGERVTFDAMGSEVNGIFLNDASTDVQIIGFEITNSQAGVGGDCFHLNNTTTSSRIKFINTVVHDCTYTGFLWGGHPLETPRAELYGSILYYNGASTFDHGVYFSGDPPATAGGFVIANNIAFDNYGYGFHGWCGTTFCSHSLEGVYDNIGANNGLLNAGSGAGNLIIRTGIDSAPGGIPGDRWAAMRNFTYHTSGLSTAPNISFGDVNGLNQGVIDSNVIVGGVATFSNLTGVTITNNKLWVGSVAGGNAPSDGVNGNVVNISNARPGSTIAYVGPCNAYEYGRVNVAIVNPTSANSVSVNAATYGSNSIDKCLRVGDQYQILKVEDFFGTPLATGTYAGGTLSFDMQASSHTMPTPARYAVPATAAPDFAAFVVRVTKRG